MESRTNRPRACHVEARDRQGSGASARSVRLAPPSTPIAFRIERVPQAVAQKIEAEDKRGDRSAREDRQMRRIEQMQPSAVQHRAPARRRRLNAKAKEAQR